MTSLGRFEWDEGKSEKTKTERGISFQDAMEVWDDQEALELPAKTGGEVRHVKIGKIGEKIYAVIFTLRGEKIRIISARRARPQEEKNYENHINRRI